MKSAPPDLQPTGASAESSRSAVSDFQRNRAAARTAIAQARDRLAQGDSEGAMQGLRPVFDEDRAHAQIRSYYGLALGLARGRYHEALDLCQSAVKQEFFNPDLYLNVARLNLAFGFRAESLRYLRRARMIDPANDGIQRLLEELGFRSEPVLRFLPRRHLLNRWLGSARYVLTRSAIWSDSRKAEARATREDRVAA
jgi:tetratricopeptide (TPR) repeat protein